MIETKKYKRIIIFAFILLTVSLFNFNTMFLKADYIPDPIVLVGGRGMK